jgi:4-hydroxy-3-polyprenylbenzoate decarboxylase
VHRTTQANNIHFDGRDAWRHLRRGTRERKRNVMQDQTPSRLIIGISGASGVVYGVRLLQLLRNAGIETHLVMSKAAEQTFAYETDLKIAEVRALANFSHPIDDMAASISSGSFRTAGMIVAPCSMRSMSEIASGVTTTLLTRAADVVLKERRRLALMVRETPLHTGHLRTMTALSEMGAIIAPPVPAFYAKPDSLDDMVEHTVGRVLDLFGIDIGVVRRWGEDEALKRRSPRKIAPYA